MPRTSLARLFASWPAGTSRKSKTRKADSSALGCGRPQPKGRDDKFRGAGQTIGLFCVVKDDAEGVAGAAVHAAHAVLHVHAIVASRAANGPVARGENDRLALIGVDDFGFRLRARLLLDEQKLPAFPVAALLAQKEYHLQRKSDLAVDVLMETVVAASFVMKQQRCGLCLADLVAGCQKRRVVGRESRTFSPRASAH